MADFSISKQISTLGEIQRAYNFELRIFTTQPTDDPLVLRVRSASIPQRSVEPITSNYMGVKQYFPGQATFTSQMTVQFEEFEDLKALKTLFDEMQKVFDIDTGHAAPGVTTKGSTGIATTAELIMYKYDGSENAYKIKLYNAWIESMNESAISYTTNESVKVEAVIRFDYWKLETV